MKKVVIPIAVLAAFAIPVVAHADGIASGTCDGLTVAAPVGSRVIIGLDAEPPYEVDDGNTRTVGFFQGVDRHVWALTVLGADGAVIDHVDGSIGGCIVTPPVSEEPVAPVAELPSANVRTPLPASTVTAASPWSGIELAPPW